VRLPVGFVIFFTVVNKTTECVGSKQVSYTVGTKVNPETAKMERTLLRAGLSYTEVAAKTGGSVKSIAERNRVVYKINIWDAFKRRIERDGIPNRLAIGDPFGYWLSGLFDGAGTFVVSTRRASGRPQYAEYRLAIHLMVRDDDADVIRRVYDHLQVGYISTRKSQQRSNPAIAITVERVQDLAEVIVPLFDRYPLYSRKAKEYAIWRPLALQRYMTTLGGYSNRSGIPEDQRLAFHEAIELIQQIRTYTPCATGAARAAPVPVTAGVWGVASPDLG